MKKSIRIIWLILALAMLLACFAGCGSKDQEKQTGNETKPDETAKETEKQTEGETEVPLPFEEGDYGFDINVLHWYVDDAWIAWEEIFVEEGGTGDIIKDDVYDRNSWLEEKYGISLTNDYVYQTDVADKIKTQISSGDDAQGYQLVVNFGYKASHTTGNDWHVDLSTVSTIDFTHPWWNREAEKTLRLGSLVEYAVSDMLLQDKGGTSLMFFNKLRCEDLGITGLYQTVRDGEWTMETLADYAALGYEDDGDGVVDAKDKFGISNGDDPVLMLYECSGMRFMQYDDDGVAYYSIRDEESQEVLAYIYDFMYNDWFFNTWIHRNETDLPSFGDEESIFDFARVETTKNLRQKELTYGILPTAKYDELDDYCGWVNDYHDSMMAMLATVSDPDQIGMAIELLSKYSYYNIFPDLYDVVICGRGTRDEESIEMLELIFQNRTYDMGIVYDVDNFCDKVLRYTGTGSTEIAQLLSTWENILDTHLDEINALIDQYS